MESKIMISRDDLHRLRPLLRSPAIQAIERESLHDLFDELDRAMIVRHEHLPSDVVALGSRALVRDLVAGEEAHYTLVLPSEANVSLGRISVLAPLGTALLGSRVGDEIEWHTPGGLRRLSIRTVRHAARAGDLLGPRASRRRTA